MKGIDRYCESVGNDIQHIQYGSSLARQCQAHMSSSYIYCTLENSRIKQETIHKESRYGALLWDQETWRGLTNFLFPTHASSSALDQMFFFLAFLPTSHVHH